VRAGFEETKKHLVNAAIRGEVDELRGTVENVMVNQLAPIGTGAFELIGHLPGAEEKPEGKEGEKAGREEKGKEKVKEKEETKEAKEKRPRGKEKERVRVTERAKKK